MLQDDRITQAERSWMTDAKDYGAVTECRCFNCGQSFLGHETRKTCRVCANPPASGNLRRDFNPYR